MSCESKLPTLGDAISQLIKESNRAWTVKELSEVLDVEETIIELTIEEHDFTRDYIKENPSTHTPSLVKKVHKQSLKGRVKNFLHKVLTKAKHLLPAN